MTHRPEQKMPWVVVAPTGVYWLGHAHNERGAWTDALGWPDEQEVAEHKRAGWYAAEATVTWRRPYGVDVPTRLLTSDEVTPLMQNDKQAMARAVQRKFCEVNGMAAPAGVIVGGEGQQ